MTTQAMEQNLGEPSSESIRQAGSHSGLASWCDYDLEGYPGYSNQWKGDVNTKLKVLGRQAIIEAKNQKNLHIQDWWIQTERQTLNWGEPVLAFKLFREPLEATKVVIYLDTFLELVKRASEPKLKEPDNEEWGTRLRK